MGSTFNNISYIVAALWAVPFMDIFLFLFLWFYSVVVFFYSKYRVEYASPVLQSSLLQLNLNIGSGWMYHPQRTWWIKKERRNINPAVQSRRRMWHTRDRSILRCLFVHVIAVITDCIVGVAGCGRNNSFFGNEGVLLWFILSVRASVQICHSERMWDSWETKMKMSNIQRAAVSACVFFFPRFWILDFCLTVRLWAKFWNITRG